MFGIMLTCFYVYGKASNHNATMPHKIYALLWCMVCALVTAVDIPWMPFLVSRIFLCAASIVFIWWVLKINIEVIISAFLLSFSVSYSLLFFSTLIIGIVTSPLGVQFESNIYYAINNIFFLFVMILIAICQYLLAFFLFKIKRFKKGFPFLFNNNAIIFTLIIAGLIILLTAYINEPTTDYGYNHFLIFSLVIGILILGAGIIIWIRRGIWRQYKKSMAEQNVVMLEQELAAAQKELYTYKQANHKTNHRLSSIERIVAGLVKAFPDSEYSEELTVIHEDIKNLTQEYQEAIGWGNENKALPGTKIKTIDNLFGHFAKVCVENNIGFVLNINGSILHMVEQVVPQNILETMIGDHIQNAINAINASDYTFRGIMVVLGLSGDCYELTVYDSGVPFEADILARLGKECVTTHAEKGGSGIGFMTTFEILREYKASLIINEKMAQHVKYTKSVSIRFDGKEQVIIEIERGRSYVE
jgi:signal transduction histidine kinase